MNPSNSNPYTMTDWLLVVEDQGDLWMMLQSFLRRHLPGVPLVRASSVITALSHLQASLMGKQPLPRLILSNLYLPNREDGFHLLVAIKSPSSGLSQLPVVVMSSSTDPADAQATREHGALFLAKPTDREGWQAFLGQVKQQWDQPSGAVVDAERANFQGTSS